MCCLGWLLASERHEHKTGIGHPELNVNKYCHLIVMDTESAATYDHKSWKDKCVEFLRKSKFPITLEPIVFFYTLSVGLNEVGELDSLWLNWRLCFVDYKIQPDYWQNLSKQAELYCSSMSGDREQHCHRGWSSKACDRLWSFI